MHFRWSQFQVPGSYEISYENFELQHSRMLNVACWYILTILYCIVLYCIVSVFVFCLCLHLHCVILVDLFVRPEFFDFSSTSEKEISSPVSVQIRKHIKHKNKAGLGNSKIQTRNSKLGILENPRKTSIKPRSDFLFRGGHEYLSTRVLEYS